MASAETPESFVRAFAALLDEAAIPYMLAGSFASGFYGAPRATQDVDIVISPTPESLDQLLNSLSPCNYYVSREAAQEALRREMTFNVIDLHSGWKADLICRKSRRFSVTEFGRRSLRNLAGVEVYVASAEDVILSKLEWAQLGGSDRQLEDAAGVLRIQGDALDQDYLQTWAKELSVLAEWEKAKALVR